MALMIKINQFRVAKLLTTATELGDHKNHRKVVKLSTIFMCAITHLSELL